jgi:hypothetical protein
MFGSFAGRTLATEPHPSMVTEKETGGSRPPVRVDVTDGFDFVLSF